MESVDCILLEITGQVTKHAAGVPVLIIKIVIIAPELTAVSHQHYLWYLSPPSPLPPTVLQGLTVSCSQCSASAHYHHND